jgi:glyoxylase-like metal-dependent hydrolase (beta-lactamase superfamily II)
MVTMKIFVERLLHTKLTTLVIILIRLVLEGFTMRVRNKDFLTQITFLTNFFPVNCYLVEEENELTLIDAALSYSYKGILNVANQMGKSITRIVLTHAHEDHVGSLDKIAERLPNAKIFISRRDSLLLKGDKSLQPDEPQMAIKGGAPKGLKSKPHHLIQDGDMIGSLLSICTQGHTPGHMAFLDIRSKALIAGDSFQTRGGIAVAGKINPLFPFPAFGTWSPKLSLKSAKKLLDVQPTLLAVGHGNMLEDPIKEMKWAINEAELFLRKKER